LIWSKTPQKRGVFAYLETLYENKLVLDKTMKVWYNIDAESKIFD